MLKLIRKIEDRFSRKVPTVVLNDTKKVKNYSINGKTIVVIGNGISASVFSRQILMLAGKENIDIKVIQIGNISCNYCGGLITNMASDTLEALFTLGIPKNVGLSKIDKCVFINSYGGFEISLNKPLISILRTSRFGEQGFDDSLKNRILEGLDKKVSDSFTAIEPATVTKIMVKESIKSIFYTIKGENKKIEADIVVLATGLRSLETNVFKEFLKETDYVPPGIMDSAVTEIDTTSAGYNELEHKTAILDGIVKDCVIGIVSKRKGWLTVTSLNKTLTVQDLETIFSHPSVKKFIDLPNVSKSLRCGIICKASVFTTPSKNFYGDGWVIIGDLTGYGRVFKDGYFAVLFGAYYAANTIMYHGLMKEDFRAHYYEKLKRFIPDNRVGIGLFNINNKFKQTNSFEKFFVEAGIREKTQDSYGNFIHAGVRAVVTGELSYKIIGLLFLFGIVRYLMRKWISSK